MYSDPSTTLPLTVENLDRKREDFGSLLEGGTYGSAATPKNYFTQDAANAAGGAVVPADFVMIGKFKTTVNEVLTCLGTQGNNYDIDDYISVTEECLKALRTLKVERRIESRRANYNARTANSSVCLPQAYGLASPTACDDDGNGERSPTPAPTTYMAALMKKKGSPKRSPFKADARTQEDVEAARQASALRSEERQRLAEERRMDRLQEMKLKSEAAEAREQRVKARREEAETRQREEAEERLESSRRRAEDVRRQTVEKAQKSHARVDEVRLSNELRHQTKAILIDRKMSDVEHNQEVQKEARQARAQEKNEAAEAAAERRRNASEELAERQKEREQQRQEKLRRIEEQKRLEQEQKQQKAEEWEKKVHRHQQEASAETEAIVKKSEEKMQQSAQVLEEQREKRRQKQELQDKKLKEAKIRREEEVDLRPTLQEFMPPMSSQEEEQMTQRVNKLVAASGRQGKAFADTYLKESQSAAKDLNRSKLRPAFSRLSSAVAVPVPAQCKQPLNDLLSTTFTDSDHEFVRYFNQFEVVVKVITEARKAREFGIIQQATDLLLLFFINETEGKNNVVYFVRSGCIVPLVLCIREEMRAARQHNNNDGLRWMLSVVGVCLERLSKEPPQSKAGSVRDQLLSDLSTLGLDRICLAILKMSPSECDLELVYCALCILNIELGVYSKRKNDSKSSWFQNIVAGFFSLLQNILTPDGVPILQAGSESMSCGRVTVLFCVFRTLNMLARWQLGAFQALLHDASASGVSLSTQDKDIVKEKDDGKGSVNPPPTQITRQELFHVLNGFFLYIQDHSDELETIPALAPSETAPVDGTNSGGKAGGSESGRPSGTLLSSIALPAVSFNDAAKYGLTLSEIPAFPPPNNSPASRDGFQPGGQHYPLRAALHECLLFVGYLCLEDKALQEMMSWGEKKPLLGNMLNVLPAQYFSNAQHVLFPTVLAAVNDNDHNMRVAMTEMEPGLLYSFVSSEFNALSKGARAYAQEHAKEMSRYKIETDPKHAVRHSLAKSNGSNWADLVDEDSVLDARTSHSTETASTTPAIEKERLCKMFRTPAPSAAQSYPSFYRVERRLPITYWPAIIEQLEEVLQSK